MLNLFKKCQKAKYNHTEDHVDYSIKVEDRTLFIFFEWSDDKADWKRNFNFPAKAYKRGNDKWWVHRGFLSAWKSVRDAIEREVYFLLSTFIIDDIKVVGYSHGAALALLATEDMTFRFGEEVKVQGWGFGCPRTLWGFIPKVVKERLKGFTSVRNIPDIVTHIPPMIFGYRNINLLKIGKPGQYSPIKAHYVSSYLDNL